MVNELDTILKYNFFLCSFLILSLSVYGQTGGDLFARELAGAALELTEQEVVYDPGYYAIDYPMGDVPADRGVCTDVVIRAYRAMDIDLQQEVHEDMLSNFELYPQIWGLNRPDPNIDHRRVPNLQRFFEETTGGDCDVPCKGFTAKAPSFEGNRHLKAVAVVDRQTISRIDC